jgi:DNA-binding XRE family transcriptional regulator
MTSADFDKNGAHYYIPRLETLRITAKLTINRLAKEADVGRDLVSSLERRHPHSRIKVQAVFDALKKYHPDLDPAVEITTHT